MVTELLGATLLNADAVFVVVGVAMGVTIFSSLVHRKVVDRKKMDEVRGRIEKHQKDYMAAQKAGDKKKMAELEKQQEEIMKLVKENMMASMKPSLITLPFALLLIWLLGSWYGKADAVIEMPFGVPFLTRAFEGAVNPMTGLFIQHGMDWFGLYIMVAISTALFLELVLRRLLKV